MNLRQKINKKRKKEVKMKMKLILLSQKLSHQKNRWNRNLIKIKKWWDHLKKHRREQKNKKLRKNRNK